MRVVVDLAGTNLTGDALHLYGYEYSHPLFGSSYFNPTSLVAVFFMGGIFLTIVYSWGYHWGNQSTSNDKIAEELAQLKNTVSQLSKENIDLKEAIQERNLPGGRDQEPESQGQSGPGQEISGLTGLSPKKP